MMASACKSDPMSRGAAANQPINLKESAMNSNASKLFIAAAFLAAVVTSGCASFGTEGVSDEGTANDGILHSQNDDAITQQMQSGSRLGGE
jgi:hypothetical protein